MRKRPVERTPAGWSGGRTAPARRCLTRVVRKGRGSASPVQPGFSAYGMPGGVHPLPHREGGGWPATGHRPTSPPLPAAQRVAAFAPGRCPSQPPPRVERLDRRTGPSRPAFRLDGDDSPPTRPPARDRSYRSAQRGRGGEMISPAKSAGISLAPRRQNHCGSNGLPPRQVTRWRRACPILPGARPGRRPGVPP